MNDALCASPAKLHDRRRKIVRVGRRSPLIIYHFDLRARRRKLQNGVGKALASRSEKP